MSHFLIKIALCCGHSLMDNHMGHKYHYTLHIHKSLFTYFILRSLCHEFSNLTFFSSPWKSSQPLAKFLNQCISVPPAIPPFRCNEKLGTLFKAFSTGKISCHNFCLESCRVVHLSTFGWYL